MSHRTQDIATLTGSEFDAFFIELMTRHHRGAIDMVDDLLRQPGTAYDPVMFEFVNDIRTEQQNEIDRMNAIAATLSTDPRAGLAAGFAAAPPLPREISRSWGKRDVAGLCECDVCTGATPKLCASAT